MSNIFDNGGMIGTAMNFSSTDRYIVGTNVVVDTPEYVGGMVINTTGGTGSFSVSFSLTGGIASVPSTGDLVIICFGTTYPTTDLDLNITQWGGSYSGVSYTELIDGFANSTYDSQVYIGYAFMGPSVATGITFPNKSFTSSTDLLATIHVWRNIDTTQPIDAIATTNIRTSSGVPLFYGITTVTDKAVIISASYSSHSGGASAYYPATLSYNFIQGGGLASYDNTIGMSSYLMTTAGYTIPQPYTWTETDSTSYSNISASVALRPTSTTTIVYGNYKNSGIWSLDSVLDSKVT